VIAQSHLLITAFFLGTVKETENMVQDGLKHTKDLKLLRQLVGEWIAGIEMKTSNAKFFLAAEQ